MTHAETLSGFNGLPLEIPAAMGGHSGVPTSVIEATVALDPGNLVCWSDDRSSTFGIARSNKVMVLERRNVTGLSIDFMRPAKGRGWVALEAKLKDQAAPTTLLQSLVYSEDAVTWLLSVREQLCSVFGVAVEVRDHGSDY